MPFLVAFTSKLAFFIALATNALLYYKLLIAILEDVKYYKFFSIII